MKKAFCLLLVASALVNMANAQFKVKGKTGGTGGTTTPTTGGNTTPTTGGKNSGGGTTTPTTKNTSAPVKPEKRYDTASGTGNTKEFGVDVKPSLRSNYGVERNPLSDRKPLPYDHIREDDATYSNFIWREIDAREKINKPFVYSAKEDNGDQRFFAILLNAIKHDSVMAFSADGGDDRFTTPMTYAEVLSKVTSRGQLDTQYVPNVQDPNVEDTVIGYRQNPFAPKPDSIYTFRIKEQVIFDKEASRLVTRIIGIAPVAKIAPIKGQPSQDITLFWIYYPDLRRSLAKSFAYNGKNASARMTWEEVFESRYYSSTIVKSSIDNPGDKRLKDMIKDPLFRLLEGENIKEKIFNYEQDLWSY
jgi:gliding motility associated protien GldN